ncbi:MAG: hypothetical protein ABI723_09205 [Bacteroidia bacterium]
MRNNVSNNIEVAMQLLINAAQNLEKSGADYIIICANTMHMYAERILFCL